MRSSKAIPVTQTGMVVPAGGGVVYGVQVVAPGIGGTLAVYDGNDASGVPLLNMSSMGAGDWLPIGPVGGARLTSGLYVAVGGAGMRVNVYVA